MTHSTEHVSSLSQPPLTVYPQNIQSFYEQVIKATLTTDVRGRNRGWMGRRFATISIMRPVFGLLVSILIYVSIAKINIMVNKIAQSYAKMKKNYDNTRKFH